MDLIALTADKLAEISAYAGAWVRSRTPVFEPLPTNPASHSPGFREVGLLCQTLRLQLQQNVNVLERVVVVVVVKINFVNSL